MTSKLKVEFIDNAESQYDENASLLKIGPLPLPLSTDDNNNNNNSNSNNSNNSNNKKQGRLYIGDKHAISFVQLKARDIQAVLCCSGDLSGHCKESSVDYCKVDAEQYTLLDSHNNSSNNSSNKLISASKNSKKTKSGKVNIGVVGTAAEFVERELRAGKNVVICCESGFRASFLFAAGFLMKTLRMSLYEALQMIERARACPAKLTPSQCKIALDVEKRLLGKNSMALEGRQLSPLSETLTASNNAVHKVPSSSNEGQRKGEEEKPKRKENGVSGLTIALGVGLFFGSLYAALYAATGKV